MTDSRRDRLLELFEGASHLDGAERRRFLDAAAADGAIRREVESLLEHHDALGDFLEPEDGVVGTMPMAAVPETAVDPVPERLGRYRVTGLLGEGGMGRVYAAEDPTLGRRIAIKVLPAAIGSDPRALAELEQEARLLAACSHPNIATVHSLEEADGARFITLEYIDGPSLADRIAEGPVPVAEAVAIAAAIARGLEVAHRQGIVHCDLKPANVQLSRDGSIKVLDFGIARAVGVEDTGAGQRRLRGTPGYLSPEQIRGRHADASADVWSLGCILFELLSGRPAHDGESADEIFRATLQDEPSWPALPADLPASVVELLHRCLDKTPVRRPPEATVVRRLLDEEIVRLGLPPVVGEPIQRAGRPTNLPHSRSTFIGREALVDVVTERLRRGRLVTVTGIGGAGKTALALEVGRRLIDDFADGVFVVELAPVPAGARVLRAVGSALGLREETERPFRETLLEFARQRQLLVILDNCEHVLDSAARGVEALLDAAGSLRILATSREGLGVVDEAIVSVPSLELPASDADDAALRSSEAVRFFLDKSRSVTAGRRWSGRELGLVTQICQRLDGIPLALEMAAKQLRMLPVDEIARRLDDRFRMLTGGARTLPRQQTLRSALDWSYELLDGAERELLRALSVFQGRFPLAAVETVGSGGTVADWEIMDVLRRLVEKSLVEVESEALEETGVRYRLLETVRHYAAERLVAEGDPEDARRRHREHFLAFAGEASENLTGPHQRRWLDRLELHHDDLRIALDSFRSANDPRSALSLAAALKTLWEIRGFCSEGRELLEAVIAEAATEPQPELAAAHVAVGELVMVMGRFSEARSHFRAALEHYENVGHRSAIAVTANAIANLDWRSGEYESARAGFERALELHRELGSARNVGGVLGNLGVLAERTGDYERALELHDESLRIIEELGDARGVAVQLNNLGVVALDLGRWDAAESHHERSLELRRRLGDQRGIALSTYNLAAVAHFRGEAETALERAEETLELSRRLELRGGVVDALVLLGHILGDRGEHRRAREVLLEGLELAAGLGDPRTEVEVLEAGARLLLRLGDEETAARILGCTAAERTRRDYRDAPALAAPLERDRERLRVGFGAGALEVLEEEGGRLTLAAAGAIVRAHLDRSK